MKSNTRPITAFNRHCLVTKQPAPCVARKIQRQRVGSEPFIIEDDINYKPKEGKYVTHCRRKSAPELPPIPQNYNSLSACRRHSVDYFSNSSSKSYLARSFESRSRESVTSSPIYDSNNNSEINTCTSTKLWITTLQSSDSDGHLQQNAIMSGSQKKESKKYRSRLSSKDHSTTSGNNNCNNQKVLHEKQADFQVLPFDTFTRSKTFTKSTKKKSKNQKRNSKSSLVNNRTLSIENIDQLTTSKTLDNEPVFGLRRSTSTHKLDKKSPTIVKTYQSNGNVDEISDQETDSEFDNYIVNWIKNVESAVLEPPPDPKIAYMDEPPQKDTAVHIIHDS